MLDFRKTKPLVTGVQADPMTTASGSTRARCPSKAGLLQVEPGSSGRRTPALAWTAGFACLRCPSLLWLGLGGTVDRRRWGTDLAEPAKNRQKDKDARWTKKHGRLYFGYKNHIGIDRRHKFVRRYVVTDAAVHDSQKLDDVLDPSNTASEVWADSAYRSQAIEQRLAERGLKRRIHRRSTRNRPLGARQQAANKTRSTVQARVEHVFGHQETSMGRKVVRTIGLVRAKMKIGMQNLVYNMRRFVTLERMAAAKSPTWRQIDMQPRTPPAPRSGARQKPKNRSIKTRNAPADVRGRSPTQSA